MRDEKLLKTISCLGSHSIFFLYFPDLYLFVRIVCVCIPSANILPLQHIHTIRLPFHHTFHRIFVCAWAEVAECWMLYSVCWMMMMCLICVYIPRVLTKGKYTNIPEVEWRSRIKCGWLGRLGGAGVTARLTFEGKQNYYRHFIISVVRKMSVNVFKCSIECWILLEVDKNAFSKSKYLNLL